MRVERDFMFDEQPHLPPTIPVAGEVEPNLPPIRGGGGRSGSGLREWTGREVVAREFSELELLSLGGHPCIARDTATLIASYPKTGKTKLIRASVGLWRQQGFSILFFTEEGERAWHERLKTDGDEWADVRFVETMNEPPTQLLARMSNGSEDIVVVDTARHAFGMKDENDNAEVARKSAPWIAAARAAGKTLVVSVHENKAGGEHGRGISGGHALFGAFDAAFEIQRVPGAPTRRLVRGWARLFDAPEFIYEQQEDGSLLALGDASAVERSQVRDRVADLLGDERETRKEIMEKLETPRPSYEQLRRALEDLVRDGIAERDPAEDGPGKTYRWRLTQPHLQPPLSIGGRSGSLAAGGPS